MLQQLSTRSYTRTPGAYPIPARIAGKRRTAAPLTVDKTTSQGSEMVSGKPAEETENATVATAALPAEGDDMEQTHATTRIAPHYALHKCR